VRVLVVSNMRADAGHPERGRFVRDQVAALRELPQAPEVELYEFAPGPRALAAAARQLHARHRGRRFAVVHAHYGLSAWPALAVGAQIRGLTVHGTDVRHPRTRQATRAVLGLMDLVAAPSPELAGELPGAGARRRALVLPCGVDMSRFRPLPRAQARAELGLDPQRPCVLFPADPGRPEKRFDRAQALVGMLATPPRLLTLGGVPPEQVPLWINAANAVLVTSEREGFGLAVLEALACDVPVLATPVGVHRQALDDLAGTLCEPFVAARWRTALEPHLSAPDPRVRGRARADRFSSLRMAAELAQAWRAALDERCRERGG
jgi:teichuronic acid biosynthesis glycosyltransferase TuaC